MIKLLPKLRGPYFDFLVLPAGECWERRYRRNRLKKEYFHHPDALRVQDAIVSVFIQAFVQSHEYFHYHRPTEYTSDELYRLGQLLTREVDAISSCRTPKQFRAKLPKFFMSECDDLIGVWFPKWRRARNELETYGRSILLRVDEAEREQKALLVLGI